MPRRVERLGEQFKREVAHLLRAQVRDPRVLGVTVTNVDVSRDLTFARIWVLISGGEEQRASSLAGLAAAAPFIRRHLGEALRIRRVPELDFQEDRTLAQARRIDELLREVGPVPPEQESGLDSAVPGNGDHEYDRDEEAGGEEDEELDGEDDGDDEDRQ